MLYPLALTALRPRQTLRVGAPVGLRLSPERPMQWLPAGINRPADGATCPLQVPFDFETELFKGRAVVFLKGLPNTPDRIFKARPRAQGYRLGV